MEEGPTERNLGIQPRMRLSRATSGLHRGSVKVGGEAGGELVQSMVVTSALRPGGIPRGQAGDSASRSASGSAETRLRNVE